VEEVLSPVQRAYAAQGNEVAVATEAVRHESRLQNIRSSITDLVQFLREVRVEMRKITWPDRRELIDATRTVIIVVLIIAGVIALMDLVLQGVLVQGIPSLFK
jgi:preprotein translocase SecE subunit